MNRLVILTLGAVLGACSADRTGVRAEGLDPASIPSDVRADYEVFAQRCSKCHSLARPLNSGIEDDAYWAMYVARMRRQPSSGISHEDEIAVLRFLHYFSLEQRRIKAKKNEPTSPETPSAAPDAGG